MELLKNGGKVNGFELRPNAGCTGYICREFDRDDCYRWCDLVAL